MLGITVIGMSCLHLQVFFKEIFLSILSSSSSSYQHKWLVLQALIRVCGGELQNLTNCNPHLPLAKFISHLGQNSDVCLLCLPCPNCYHFPIHQNWWSYSYLVAKTQCVHSILLGCAHSISVPIPFCLTRTWCAY